MPSREPRLDAESSDRITLRLLREWLYISYPAARRAEILVSVAENVARHPHSYLARMWRQIYREAPAAEPQRKPWMD